MPDSSDNYQLPSWPPTAINRDLWNAVMGSIAARLTAREELEADFEALIAQGTQASLDYIQATVAPQIASLQTSIELAQEQIDQIIVDGIAPNAAKLGGQLPAYYAPASALPLKADVTYVDSELLDLATAIQLLLDQKAGETETANALSKRTRVDAAQSFTQAERGQARANIGGGVLAGFRNKIINGNFDRDLWQRGTSLLAAAGSRFCADRWNAIGIGSTTTVLRVAFAPGQTDVPGEPEFFHRIGVSSVAGAGNAALLRQNIEGVRTLAGELTTRTFYMKADAPRTVACEVVQVPGTGGSPSAQVVGIGVQKFNLTTQWQRFDVVVALPSISGMVLGTNLNDAVQLNWWLDAGSSFNSRTGSLGQQSGTFDIARVSFVEGDATTEDDPFSPRHPQQEEMLCQRYCEVLAATIFGGFQTNANSDTASWIFKVRKRATPAMAWGAGTSPNGRSANVDFAAATNAAGGAPAVGGGTIADAEL